MRSRALTGRCVSDGVPCTCACVIPLACQLVCFTGRHWRLLVHNCIQRLRMLRECLLLRCLRAADPSTAGASACHPRARALLCAPACRLTDEY